MNMQRLMQEFDSLPKPQQKRVIAEFKRPPLIMCDDPIPLPQKLERLEKKFNAK